MILRIQKIYDEWEQPDPERGYGGICDEVAEAVMGVITENFNVNTDLGGHEGDEHAWVIIRDEEEKPVIGVDVPCYLYERGAGYTWEKVEDVVFKPEDIQIFEL